MLEAMHVINKVTKFLGSTRLDAVPFEYPSLSIFDCSSFENVPE